MSKLIITNERHYNAAVNAMAKEEKKTDRLLDQIIKREDLIKEQIKMQNNPYTRMKRTISMLRKIEEIEGKILRSAKGAYGLDARAILKELLKQHDMREIDIPEDYEANGKY